MHVIGGILNQLFHKGGGDKGRIVYIGLLILFTLLLLFTERPSLAANINQISLKETAKSSEHLNVDFKQGFFSIHVQNAPLGEVLSEIEKHSGFAFSIDEGLRKTPVTVNLSD